MSDTPRTDAAYARSTGAGVYEVFKESQDIERELNAANKRLEEIETSGVYDGRPINTYTGAKEDEPFHSIECCTSSTTSKIDVDLIDTENHNQQNQEELKARIKQLKELGKELRECANLIGNYKSNEMETIEQAEAAVKAWDKEAKL